MKGWFSREFAHFSPLPPATPQKKPGACAPPPISIKCLAMDDQNIFIGTTNGHVVSVPIDKLSQKQTVPPLCTDSPSSPPQQGGPRVRNKKSNSIDKGTPPRKPPRKVKRTKSTQTVEDSTNPSPLTTARSSDSSHYGGSEENDSSEQDEVEGVFLDQSAVSLHCHRDRVRTLLHVVLPKSRRELTTQRGSDGTSCFNSMPNLSAPGYRLPLGQPLFKSLVVSIGKGHTEYSVLPPESEQNIEDVAARRERNKAFQLMLWGHRNSIP